MASAFGVGAANMFGAGRNDAGNNNPFSLQPFGGTSPFSQQTGMSFFGNTSTGNFGQTTTFGGTSSLGVGSSTPNFGGSNVCGQKPAFGGFGSNTQTNPSLGFGSTSTFGNTTFGTTPSPFGTPRSPFAQVTTSSVGSGGFGQPKGSRVARYSYTSEKENGKLQSISAMNVYKDKIHEELRWEDYQRGDNGGHTTTGTSVAPSSMGQSNLFTSSTPFSQTTPNLFSSNSTTNPFSSFSTTLFGQTTSNSFTANSTTNPSTAKSNPFRSSFSTLFSQTAPNLLSANASTNPSTAQSNPFSSTSMTFTQTTPNPFTSNALTFPSIAQSNPFNSLTSLTHSPFSTNSTTNPSTSQSNPFSSSTTAAFIQTTPNPFSTNATTNPSTSHSNPFSSSTPTTFVQTTPNLFSANFTTNPSTSQSNPFNSSTSTTFIQTTPNPFSPNATTNPSTSHSNPFSSTTLTTSQTPNIFSPNATTFPSTGKSNQTGYSPWGQSGLFTSSSLNSFTTSKLAQTPASASAPFLQTIPAQTSTGINFSNLGTLPSNLFQKPTLPAQTNNNFNSCNSGPNQSGTGGSGSGNGNELNSLGQNVGHLSSNQKIAVAQRVAVRNPFGMLPAMPHMSSVQYGISSMPVVDKPTPIRISPLLSSRLRSQHRLRLPVTKYHPKHNGSRVAFFSDENEVPRTSNADALLIPRENPRALIVQPLEHWPPNTCKKEASMVILEIDDATKSRSGEEQCNLDRRSQKPGGLSDDSMNHKEDSNISISGRRAGEPATVYEKTSDIEAMMPKLRHSEYYTEPHIQELATKERGEPGFCTHVKDFVVGRHGYGSIKFLWDTDVRRLDLDSIVQFNNREVNVYMDERKKPPVGQGLNKSAEVTLLNIKCYDKKTGNQILEGPRIGKYKEMLKKKSEDQGAEFLSYDPLKGEWKFRVGHF